MEPLGILPVNKPQGITSFYLVRLLRKILGVKKIGHAGTLDPFATGVMVMLIGRSYTRLSDTFLNDDKEYIGRIHLGIVTDTFDCDGRILQELTHVPTTENVQDVIKQFQGTIKQLPPMYSAKKINGKKLYEHARKGETVERKTANVRVETEILSYSYPYLDIRVKCSKGTYIRSLAHDIGELLGCGGHLISLTRTRSGRFKLEGCFDGKKLLSKDCHAQDLPIRGNLQR